MKKTLIFNNFMLLAICATIAAPCNAQSTDPRYFTGSLPQVNSVAANGGTINTTINATTGALDASFTPGFTIVKNNEDGKWLTQSWACNTTSGMQNAIFSGSGPQLILTNTDSLPNVSSVNNIKTGSPTPSLNPNAIAYAINDPPNIMGRLATEFQPATNDWKLHVIKNGSLNTSQTVPAAAPYPNTFSGDDDAGRYQATVTLSFDP